MTDTSAKYFHSGMSGAPTLTRAAGSVIAILRACLVNGFAPATIDSISVASGVATATISTGMIYASDVVLLISGCTNSALNGEKKLSSVSTYAATFDATGVADGTYTGSPISAKLSPAGWAEVYAGKNISAFQSLDPKSTKCLIRVDDTGATNARVVGYETMSGINTGTGKTPTAAQSSGGLYWGKSNADTDAAKSHTWMLFADSRVIYFCPMPMYTTEAACIYVFGDLAESVANDPYAWVIQGGLSDQSALNGVDERFNSGYMYSSTGLYTPRDEAGGGASTMVYRGFAAPTSPSISYAFGDSYSILSYPSARGGNALAASPVFCFGGSIFGQFPGVLAPICTCGALTALSTVLLSGGKYIACPITGGSNSPQGTVFFGVSGAWR